VGERSYTLGERSGAELHTGGVHTLATWRSIHSGGAQLHTRGVCTQRGGAELCAEGAQRDVTYVGVKASIFNARTYSIFELYRHEYSRKDACKPVTLLRLPQRSTTFTTTVYCNVYHNSLLQRLPCSTVCLLVLCCNTLSTLQLIAQLITRNATIATTDAT